MTKTMQLNTRLSSELKTAGDQALAQAGISPTKLIRLVWSKVAAGPSDLQQLLQVLQTVAPTTKSPMDSADAAPSSPTTPATTGAAPIAQGPKLFSEGLARLGVSNKTATAVAHATSSSNWKDLREEAAFGRLHQRGVV